LNNKIVSGFAPETPLLWYALTVILKREFHLLLSPDYFVGFNLKNENFINKVMD